MLRLTANKTKLYTLVAGYVENLPPMRGGTIFINYEDTEKALMAYNMGPAGALQAWEAGVTSTEYTEKVMEAANRWEAVLG